MRQRALSLWIVVDPQPTWVSLTETDVVRAVGMFVFGRVSPETIADPRQQPRTQDL